MGEDGLHGLGDGSRSALDRAQVVFGGERHLTLAGVAERGRAWSVPFDVAPVLALRGTPVVVLASGDPFWFGAGGSLSAQLVTGEWQSFPAPSTFSLAASRLAWRLETVQCFGLHATPFASIRNALQDKAQLLCLLRDGAAARDFAAWLTQQGAGASNLWVLEALGGPRERIRQCQADALDWSDIQHPVAVGVQVAGMRGLPQTPGLPDASFSHDGQITKSPVRALTLSALAPRPGEQLWDLGAGSGSISVEWCLRGGRSCAVEQHAERVANIQANAKAFGVAQRLSVHHGHTPELLSTLPAPDAVFVGGGFDVALFEALRTAAPKGCRLVVNAVTLDTEAALLQLHGQYGGELLRIELAQAAPLGRLRGWKPSRPVVQWSVTL